MSTTILITVGDLCRHFSRGPAWVEARLRAADIEPVMVLGLSVSAQKWYEAREAIDAIQRIVNNGDVI